MKKIEPLHWEGRDKMCEIEHFRKIQELVDAVNELKDRIGDSWINPKYPEQIQEPECCYPLGCACNACKERASKIFAKDREKPAKKECHHSWDFSDEQAECELCGKIVKVAKEPDCKAGCMCPKHLYPKNDELADMFTDSLNESLSQGLYSHQSMSKKMADLARKWACEVVEKEWKCKFPVIKEDLIARLKGGRN